jgi:hypothetical protein
MKRVGLPQRLPKLGTWFVLTSVCALLCLLPSVERSARASNRVILAVLVAHSSAVQDLSMSTLRRIFINEGATDPSDQRYVPFNHPPRTTDRMAFDKLVLGMSADEVSQFWIERKIRGMPGPPRSVDSLSLLLRLISRLPGAIGYARSPQIPGEVRAIRVNGKLPNDPAYPLAFSE